MRVWISTPNNWQMWPVWSTFLKTAWRSRRCQRGICWCWRSWWNQRSVCRCWRRITGLLWAFKWSNTFFHNSESKPLKDSGRERPSHCRFLTTSKSTGQSDCRAWSSAGSSFTSVVFIFSNRSRISSDAGSIAQTGDGLDKDINNPLRSLSAKLFASHHSTTAFLGGEWVDSKDKRTDESSSGLWGLQYPFKRKSKKKLEKFPGSFGINQHISSRMSWLVVGLFLFLDTKSKFT